MCGSYQINYITNITIKSLWIKGLYVKPYTATSSQPTSSTTVTAEQHGIHVTKQITDLLLLVETG